ncbi:MAG: GAF domain-containing protein [Pseudanabaenaceae cyanobacterium SKYGB_i_bin29]|nr:GAF domain-containing protein [Pseudanabaenaceae cyanobacterium SKYG29]MDW8420772.1 GAF domain-containing protein [Pseudanabaenaceae cyanobacterium SKYGB_i_bin29]
MGETGSNYWDRQFVSLGRAVHTLREASSEAELIATAISYLKEAFDYRLIWIALFDSENYTLIGKGGVTPAGDIKFLYEKFKLEPGDLLDTVVVQRKPLPIPDLRQEIRSGEWMKVAQKFEVQGTIIYPIFYRKTTVGLSILGSHHWNVSPRAEEKAKLSILFGTLAASLNRLQLESQQQKRADDPLLNCLDRFRSITQLQQRLEEVVEETQRFLSPTRTYLYWYDPQQRLFVRRAANRLKAPGKKSDSHTISPQGSPALYQTLSSGQMVAIANTKTTRSDLNLVNLRVFNNPNLGAFMVAPITLEGDLVGFLLVENDQPRLWTEEEKRYLKGITQLLSLLLPLEEMDKRLQQVTTDQVLVAGIAQAVYSEEEFHSALEKAATQLCQRLQAERFWLAALNSDRGTFEIYYQYHPKNVRPLPPNLGELSPVDTQLLEQSLEAVAVENLEYDLKFLAWRSVLANFGIKTLLLNSTRKRKAKLEGIVVVGHTEPRAWSKLDRELLRSVAQQLGVLLQQRQMQRRGEEQDRLLKSIKNALLHLQSCYTLDTLHRTAVQEIVKVTVSPLAVLLTWLPGRSGGNIAASFATQDAFKLNYTETTLSIDNDPLVQWCLQTDGVLTLSVHDLPEVTRQWLNAPGIGQVAAMALHIAPHLAPTGLILVADRLTRVWEEAALQALAIVVNQLAWLRRDLVLVEDLLRQKQELERLNWYKTRRLEEIKRSVGVSLQRLNSKEGDGDTNLTARLQQTANQLQNTIAPLANIEKESWRLRLDYDTASLSGILKRALERLENIVHQKQLWVQIHNQINATIVGDIGKIEMVFHELLLFACNRSAAKERIDIWCREEEQRAVEIVITDYGEVDPQLLQELQEGRSPDFLVPSLLDQPPGLNIAICQRLMAEAGGEVAIYVLEDHRTLTRLVLPIATSPA